jgi:hypothetical protein
MNNDTTPGNVMVERRIINAESERKDGVPVTEDFFSTIAPDFPFENKGTLPLLWGRPDQGREAVLFITLVERRNRIRSANRNQELHYNWIYKGVQVLLPLQPKMVRLRCALQYKGYLVLYGELSETGWRRHKKWCGKTKDQSARVLVERTFEAYYQMRLCFRSRIAQAPVGLRSELPGF